jgi:hypothetical protein
MENFLIRHTIPMPSGQEPLRRHYSLETSSKTAALKAAYRIDDGDKANTIVEVIAHVGNGGWPVYDL